MNILLVDNHTKDIVELERLISKFDFTTVLMEDFSAELASNFDLIIFSGGSNVRSVKNHPADYQTEIDFIKNTNKKVIGICLGSQIVATAFDCTLIELASKEEGVIVMNLNNNDVPVYDSHRFGIKVVSNDIDVLARSSKGIEMFKHKTKPIYGLQFHPEMFVDKTMGDEIFYKILKDLALT